MISSKHYFISWSSQFYMISVLCRLNTCRGHCCLPFCSTWNTSTCTWRQPTGCSCCGATASRRTTKVVQNPGPLRLHFTEPPVGDDLLWFRADGSIRWGSFSLRRLLALGSIVISVCALSFGPFIAMVTNLIPSQSWVKRRWTSQYQQSFSCCFRVKSRRFCPGSFPSREASATPTGPPTSGPCTTCWTKAWSCWVRLRLLRPPALQAWSLRWRFCLTCSGAKLKLLEEAALPRASMTGGLVQEFQHSVLPSVSPSVTLVCTLLSILVGVQPHGCSCFVESLITNTKNDLLPPLFSPWQPAVAHLWLRPRGPGAFLRCLLICALGSFMFGWHVHEKAILIAILPLRSAKICYMQEKKNLISKHEALGSF